MSLKLVIPNKDNLVSLIFGGIDLTESTKIEVVFGSESYGSISDPAVVIIKSATELDLNLSNTSEVGKIFVTVTYFDAGSVNGTDITSRELNNLSQIIVAVGSQIIVEDGTIVENANSYVTDDEFKSYANLRCFDVPPTQPERESLLILGMDYLASQESKMQGVRVDSTQELSYPRVGVCLYNQPVSASAIPANLKQAQIELAIQAKESPLLISENTQNLASFNVDDVYAETYFSGGSWTEVRTDRADAYLSPLLKNGGSTHILTRF